ncbi:MAG: hypothetical protein U0452_08060 [Anaerolineae bacterium]
MHNSLKTLRRALPLLAVALMLALVVAPAAAQDAEPTFTPSDPLMRAFSAVRQALGTRFNTDLTYVSNYSWEQAEFVGGIDACAANVEDPRELYYGWRFVITDLLGNQYEGRSSFDSTIVTACDEVTAGTVASGGTGGNLPAPVAGGAAGGAFELGGHVLDLNAGTVNLMNRAGMKWVKHQVRYSPGQDPAGTKALIDAAHANGFKVLLGVVGDPTQLGDVAGYAPGYASFVGGLASLGADAIEVWNEPNIDREWPAGSINGANYTQLLAPAYNAIKSANPNTIVISGAPAPTGYFGAAGCAQGGCNDDTFMQQMAAAGAAQYLDCVGLHYNEGIIPPSQSSGDPRGGYPTYYFGSMTNRGYSLFGGKPVCFTELGYLSPQGFNSGLPASFSWAANTTVAQQASWLAEAATLAAQGGQVRLMIVWNVDFPNWGSDPAGGYAMFRPDQSCPACDTLGTVMRQ